MEVTESLPEPMWLGFAVLDVTGLESSCRVSIFREAPRGVFAGLERVSSRFATQTLRVHLLGIDLIGRTPKGASCSRGRSRHLLETAFSEPLLRTLLRTLFYCKTHSRPPSQNPSQNAVLPYAPAPLGVHPI